MDQQDTKTLILDAAEVLFGEHGFDGTSLRKLTSTAGVNLAAVNYHFRSKEGLLDALFARRLEPMNRQRLDLLDQIQQEYGDQPWPLDKVVHALVWPPLKLWHDREGGGDRFLRLLGRIHSEPSPQVRSLFERYFAEIERRFTEAFARCLPNSSAPVHLWGGIFTIGAMAHSMCMGEQLAPRYPALNDESAEVLCHRLVTYATAGIRAMAQG